MRTVNLIEEIRPSSIRELAGIYGCCEKTMKKWIMPFLEEVGAKNGRYYSVAQVKVMFEKLGLPCKIQK